jgi:hypothetical protein
MEHYPMIDRFQMYKFISSQATALAAYSDRKANGNLKTGAMSRILLL